MKSRLCMNRESVRKFNGIFHRNKYNNGTYEPIAFAVVESQQTIFYRENFDFNRIHRDVQCLFYNSAGSLNKCLHAYCCRYGLVCGNIPVERKTNFPFNSWPPFMSAISPIRRRSTFAQRINIYVSDTKSEHTLTRQINRRANENESNNYMLFHETVFSVLEEELVIIIIVIKYEPAAAREVHLPPFVRVFFILRVLLIYLCVCLRVYLIHFLDVTFFSWAACTWGRYRYGKPICKE